MVPGYCNNCHRPIGENEYRIVRGKKICLDCINQQKKDTESETARLVQNDKDKEGLFAFLLSLFPIGTIPESWYTRVDGMLKKRFTCEGIRLTIQYCINTAKNLTEVNWGTLVYLYYYEAMGEERRRKKIQAINEQKEIVSKVETVKIKDTNYRDLPDFNIEDL